MDFEAVVFDMDGVIFDTEKIYRRFYLEEGKNWGITDDLMVQACELIAGGNKYTNKVPFEKLIGRGIDYFEFRENVIRNLDKYVLENGVEIKAGVRETLEFLRDKHIKIGLATSTVKDRAEKYLGDHNISDYFDKLIFGNMVEHGKPEPDIYIKSCEELEIKPENAIAIEDSINGIISAGKAGMYPVMVIDLIKPNEKIAPFVKQIYNNMLEIKQLIK